MFTLVLMTDGLYLEWFANELVMCITSYETFCAEIL